MYDIPSKITKEFILKNISAEEIFEFYGIKITDRKFTSPFRKSDSKTCQFFVTGNNSLKINDFARGKYDCFDTVSLLYGLTFPQTLELIAKDFDLAKYITKDRIKKVIDTSTIENKPRPRYDITSKPYLANELQFWNFSDTLFLDSDLQFYDIWSVKHWFIDNSLYKCDLKNCFAYKLNNIDIQFYRPYAVRKEDKFRSSYVKSIFGLKYAKKGQKQIIVCKSYKDFFFVSMTGANACCVISENFIFTEEDITLLHEYGEEIILYFDNDDAGKRYAEAQAERWELHTVYNQEKKDFYEFGKANSMKDGIQMLKEMKIIFINNSNLKLIA